MKQSSCSLNADEGKSFALENVKTLEGDDAKDPPSIISRSVKALIPAKAPKIRTATLVQMENKQQGGE